MTHVCEIMSDEIPNAGDCYSNEPELLLEISVLLKLLDLQLKNQPDDELGRDLAQWNRFDASKII